MLKIKITNGYLFYVALLIGFFLSASIEASSYIEQEVSSADKQRIFERLTELSKDTDSITATINQEKQLSLLKEKICIEGTLIMKNQTCSDGISLNLTNLSLLLMVKQ